MTNRRVFLTALAAIGAVPLAACELPLPFPPEPDPPGPSPWGTPVPVGDADGHAFQEVTGTLDFSRYSTKARESFHLFAVLTEDKYREMEPLLKASGECRITQTFEDGTQRLFRVEQWHAEPEGAGWRLDIELDRIA